MTGRSVLIQTAAATACVRSSAQDVVRLFHEIKENIKRYVPAKGNGRRRIRGRGEKGNGEGEWTKVSSEREPRQG
jgi:hypothetical protein